MSPSTKRSRTSPLCVRPLQRSLQKIRPNWRRSLAVSPLLGADHFAVALAEGALAVSVLSQGRSIQITLGGQLSLEAGFSPPSLSPTITAT